MQGGIYNAALFGASQREARGKLEQMGGIKRPGPSGILASSPELMNAVGNAAAPAMPVRATGPATPITPAPVQQAQVALPQVPAPMTVAPGPVQQAPAPTPAVPQPAAPTTPMRFQPGGPVTLNEQFRGYSEMGERLAQQAKEQDTMVVDITQDPVSFLENMDKQTGGAVTKQFGSTEKALEEGEKKAQNIYAAMDTEDESKVGDAVVKEAGLEPTDENKQEFARTVLGIDTDDIGEIDDAIFNTLTADVSLSGQKLQQAVLLGLQNYKQTASARAAAVSGAKASTYTPERLFQQAVEKIMGNPEQFDVYNEEGSAVDPMKVRREAMKIAQATSTAMTGGGADNRMVAYDASGKPFYSTDGVNYVDAQGNPYVPPKE